MFVGEKVGLGLSTRPRNPHHQLGPVRTTPPHPTCLCELFNPLEHEEKGAGCRLTLHRLCYLEMNIYLKTKKMAQGSFCHRNNDLLFQIPFYFSS